MACVLLWGRWLNLETMAGPGLCFLWYTGFHWLLELDCWLPTSCSGLSLNRCTCIRLPCVLLSFPYTSCLISRLFLPRSHFPRQFYWTMSKTTSFGLWPIMNILTYLCPINSGVEHPPQFRAFFWFHLQINSLFYLPEFLAWRQTPPQSWLQLS